MRLIPRNVFVNQRIILFYYDREGNWHLSRLKRDAASRSRSSRRGRARMAQGLSVQGFRDSWKLLTTPRGITAGVSFLGRSSGSHCVRIIANNSWPSVNRRFVVDGDGFASIMKSAGLTLKALYSRGAGEITRRSHRGARVCVPGASKGWRIKGRSERKIRVGLRR